MIWQMDLLLILSERERERMADGEEVKREHLEGDREKGCVKGPGCQTIQEDSARNTHNPVEIEDGVCRTNI